jgi:FKBP-type peptidyl-prolyl cis-trans isomerase
MKTLLTLSLATVALSVPVFAKDKPLELKPTTTAKVSAPAATTVAAVAPAAEAKPSPFKDDQDKNGYALGMNVGVNWKRQGMPHELINLDSFTRGLKDTLTGSPALLSEPEVRATLMALQQTVAEQKKLEAEKAKDAGVKFLADNKAKPGVVTLPSGLQYKVITDGKGESPKPEDTVTVDYRGTLVDGTEFDSSYKRGQPATFRVGGVIKGWTEALQLMKPGSKWELYIPNDLAYGENAPPGSGIPAGAPLVFEVALQSFSRPTPPPAPPMPTPITSDIIKVPSAEELKHGAKIETIKAEDIQKELDKAKKK